ncbi:MAG: YihA family ribosome biogenesis GTP-binding protein [Betaproteobacteria bacterium]|nr:YihA family ribosome biogenesis GTP-binding protein [Betaproteobacteria bacterium]
MPSPKPPSRAFSDIQFLISASRLEGLPQDDLPEVAFVGRSNVGKSSALNILANRRRLAFVSKTPGRTQLINFFSLGKGARLVDLPGYGYAKVPHGVRDEWGKLVAGYLQTRRSLLGVVSLMDARRPLTELDVQLLGWLVPLQRRLLVLLTKADKLTKSEQGRTLIATQKELGKLDVPGQCVLFSSQTRQGVDTTREHIEAWLAGK